jgi:putative ABC transport system permease protein
MGMLGNVFLTFYRITTRHPLYAALDLLGLSFGVAVFVTLALYVRFETSFEQWLPHADETYLQRIRYTLPGKPAAFTDHTNIFGLDAIKEDYPDVVGIRMWQDDADIRMGETSARIRQTVVDPDFFQLFDLPVLAGDRAAALAGPGRVLLSETAARKFLPHGEGVGATIHLADAEGDNPYIVTGILADPPRNSDFNFDVVRLLTPATIAAHPKWQEFGVLPIRTWLRLGTRAEADRMDAQADDAVDRHMGNRDDGRPMHTLVSTRLLPLTAVHLDDARSRGALYSLGLVALLSLVVAAINHVNLATALASMRAREVAVRRTLGGTRRGLAGQFLLEAMLTSLLAWIGGLSMVELGLPLLNQAAGLSLSLAYGADGVFFLSMMGAVVLLGLLSGLYPAFVLSRFKPALVLASSRWPSGGRLGFWVREALVVLQFTVVAVFFVLTWGFFAQIAHLQAADLGFHREGLLVTNSTSDAALTQAARRQVWAAMRQVPGVASVGSAETWPGEEDGFSHVVLSVPERADIKVSGLRAAIEANFFASYGASLLAGRFLDPALPADDEPSGDAPLHVVLNAKMSRLLGFDSPEQAVGHALDLYGKPVEVVGVVGDLRFRSPKVEQDGVYYYAASAGITRHVMAVRFEGVAEPEMRARLAEAWRSVAPGIPLELKSAQDSLDQYYAPDRVRSRLIGIAAAGAALIGCLGLYGMAAFGASRRMLELAIRKVLGATRGRVVRLLVGRFLRPVLLANLLAAPIAYWVLAQWLTQFNDRIAITAAPFLATAGIVVAIAVLTVTALSFTAASRAPARVLHHE